MKFIILHAAEKSSRGWRAASYDVQYPTGSVVWASEDGRYRIYIVSTFVAIYLWSPYDGGRLANQYPEIIIRLESRSLGGFVLRWLFEALEPLKARPAAPEHQVHEELMKAVDTYMFDMRGEPSNSPCLYEVSARNISNYMKKHRMLKSAAAEDGKP